MFTLSRTQFVDRLLEPDDLVDMTNLWMSWHEDARLSRGSLLHGYRAVELRLYSFPRQRGELLKEELERRLRERGWDYSVDLSDPAFLRVSSPFLSFIESCSLGDWLALVQIPTFFGLVAFLRLSTHDWPGRPEGPAHAGNTLVLCGQLQEDGFLLKGLWPANLERETDSLFEMAVWPEEARFLRAFEHFRHTGTVPSAPTDLFSSRRNQKWTIFLASLIVRLPYGRKRLYWFLTRTGFHSAGLVLFAALYFALPYFPGIKEVLGLLAIGLGTALGYVLFQEASRVWRLHRNIKASLKRIYTHTLTFETVDLTKLGLQDDPNLIKYTAELEALGCRHLADARPIPNPASTTYVRVFVLSAANTYVFLNLMVSTRSFQKFPAHAFFLISTYFDDLRLVTIHEGGGFRKQIILQVQSQVFPGVHDPALLLAAHRKRVEHQLREGHALTPLMQAPALLDRMARDHAEASSAMRKYGYFSWSAAVRQNFKLVRPELLGKIEDQ
jgi:hypothetical protein